MCRILQLYASILAGIKQLIAIGTRRSVSITFHSFSAIDGNSKHQMVWCFYTIDLQHISFKADFQRRSRRVAPVLTGCRIAAIGRSPSAVIGISF